MSDWIPEDGETVILHNDLGLDYEYGKESIGKKIQVVNTFNDGGLLLAVVRLPFGLGVFEVNRCLKPLPTEEDDLINELQQLDNVYHDQSDYYPIMAKALIKAGYRKVEPISRDEFLKISRDLSVNPYGYLIDNNHIVVKGE